jgi:hypothetical protein
MEPVGKAEAEQEDKVLKALFEEAAHKHSSVHEQAERGRSRSELAKDGLGGYASRSVPEKAVDYFTTNAERMRYPTFRAQGMHVGSGMAEAGCQDSCSYSPQAFWHALDSCWLGCTVASAHLRSQPHLRRFLGGPTTSGGLTTHN